MVLLDKRLGSRTALLSWKLQATVAGFRKRCQIDCQQFIHGSVEQQLQETAANNCIQTYSNHLIRNRSFPKCFSRKIFKSFPQKSVFFFRFQTIKLQYYTKPQKSYWIFQTKIKCTTPLIWGIINAPPHLPNSAWMLSTADKVGGVASTELRWLKYQSLRSTSVCVMSYIYWRTLL